MGFRTPAIEVGVTWLTWRLGNARSADCATERCADLTDWDQRRQCALYLPLRVRFYSCMAGTIS